VLRLLNEEGVDQEKLLALGKREIFDFIISQHGKELVTRCKIGQPKLYLLGSFKLWS
jgi:hypothetical protein